MFPRACAHEGRRRGRATQAAEILSKTKAVPLRRSRTSLLTSPILPAVTKLSRQAEAPLFCLNIFVVVELLHRHDGLIATPPSLNDLKHQPAAHYTHAGLKCTCRTWASRRTSARSLDSIASSLRCASSVPPMPAACREAFAAAMHAAAKDVMRGSTSDGEQSKTSMKPRICGRLLIFW